MKTVESHNDLVLTQAQFEVLAELLRSRGTSKSIAQLVFVGQLTPTEAAIELGIKTQALYGPLLRYRAAYEKVNDAFGPK